MDIEKILSACGAVDVAELAVVRKEFIGFTKGIRDSLGENSKILDDFMLALLTAINKISVLDAVDGVFDNATEVLRNLIKGVRDGDAEVTSHPFYPTLSEYVSKHPCPVLDLYLDYYSACLHILYSEFAVKQYLEGKEAELRTAATEANIISLKARLLEFVEPDVVEQIYEHTYKRFLVTSPSKLFLQCMTDSYIFSCLNHSSDGKYIFQFILDGDVE